MGSGIVTVLVVDDEPALRLLCRINLELEDFRVVEAGTLSDAREALEAEPVDVVLLDVHVGPDDGRVLLEELRASEAPVRVVMLTGSVDATSRRLESADRVIMKPFEPVQLVDAVRELAAARRVDSAT
jgi:two-component system, OmpR family, response regulator